MFSNQSKFQRFFLERLLTWASVPTVTHKGEIPNFKKTHVEGSFLRARLFACNNLPMSPVVAGCGVVDACLLDIESDSFPR